jgi:hypothetical protein
MSETCWVSFQNKNFWEISASSWFYCKKAIIIPQALSETETTPIHLHMICSAIQPHSEASRHSQQSIKNLKSSSQQFYNAWKI